MCNMHNMRTVTKSELRDLIDQVLYDIGIVETEPFSYTAEDYKIILCGNINTTLDILNRREMVPAEIARRFNDRVMKYIYEDDVVKMDCARGYFIITYNYNVILG